MWINISTICHGLLGGLGKLNIVHYRIIEFSVIFRDFALLLVTFSFSTCFLFIILIILCIIDGVRMIKGTIKGEINENEFLEVAEANLWDY
jgi:uncharacterized membrane protein